MLPLHRWKEETGYVLFVMGIVPSMAVLWRDFGWLIFSVASMWLAAVFLFIDPESWKFGSITGSVGLMNEFFGTTLGLWSYAEGFPFLGIFMGFYIIGAALAISYSFLSWDRNYRKRYKGNPVLKNLPFAIMAGVALNPTTLIAWRYLGWAASALVSFLFIGWMVRVDRELLKPGLITCALGLLEEAMGVYFGLWGGYPGGFPVFMLSLGYITGGCAFVLLASVLGLAYFRK